MKVTELLARHIEEVHEGGNWTEVDVKSVLADVSFSDASILTAGSVNTIFALLHHITFYLDVVFQRLSRTNPAIAPSNGFERTVAKNEEDWSALRSRNLLAAGRLAAAVRSFPEEKLLSLTPTGQTTYYKMLQGLVEHTYYHLGQIVIIRNLLQQTKKAS